MSKNNSRSESIKDTVIDRINFMRKNGITCRDIERMQVESGITKDQVMSEQQMYKLLRGDAIPLLPRFEGFIMGIGGKINITFPEIEK